MGYTTTFQGRIHCSRPDSMVGILIARFLGPRNHRVNGRARWFGEDPDDRGILTLRDNVVTAWPGD